jgi:hypothetical protein
MIHILIEVEEVNGLAKIEMYDDSEKQNYTKLEDDTVNDLYGIFEKYMNDDEINEAIEEINKHMLNQKR